MVGAILAGGAGRRIGGGKPARLLAGRPLVAYPAEALATACERVAVVCKQDDEIPDGPWERWDGEPAEPRHPAAGIAYALERAGAATLVCAGDMPFVRAGDAERLVSAALDLDDTPAVVAATDDGLQPLFAVYPPAAAAPLMAAAERGDPLRAAVESLAPVTVELPAWALRSIDTAAALDAAERELRELG